MFKYFHHTDLFIQEGPFTHVLFRILVVALWGSHILIIFNKLKMDILVLSFEFKI